MSRKKLKSRDKLVRRMSKDGLSERNLTTGEDVRISKREAELDLRGEKPGGEPLSRNAKSVKPLSKRNKAQYRQAGQSRDTKPAGNEGINRQNLSPSTDEPTAPQSQQYETEQTDEQPQSPRQADNARPMSGKQHGARRFPQRAPKSKPPPAAGSAQIAFDTAKSITEPSPTSPPEHGTQSELRFERGGANAAAFKPKRRQRLFERQAAEPAGDGDTGVPAKPQDISQPRLQEKESELRFEGGDAPPQAEIPKSKQQPQIQPQSVYMDEPPPQTAQPKADSKLNQLPKSVLRINKQGRLQYIEDEPVPTAPAKPKRPQQAKPPQDEKAQPPNEPPNQTDGASDNAEQYARTEQSADQHAPLDTPPQSVDVPQAAKSGTRDGKTDTPPNRDKHGKLKFTPDEAAPPVPSRAEAKQTRKLGKSQRQADKAVTKLEAAKNRLPAKKKLRTQRVFSEETGKTKRKLYFESELKPQAEHLKGALPLRPVKAAGNLAIVHAHRKLYQAERENAATEAAHKGELIVEGGIRSALRHHKTAPYRKVRRLEHKAQKKSINLAYQKTLAENPQLQSNVFSRMAQKRKIKKDYAKAAREAKKNAERVKKAGSAVSNAGKAVVEAFKRHPIASIVLVLILLLLLVFMSLLGAFGELSGGSLGGILSSSYLAEDADVDDAELAYTEWETDLQEQIANMETAYPGYDEYRYNVGEISHNPYELMAYLTAAYQNFTYAGIETDLRALFTEQYSLTFTPTTETRYADPTDANEDGDYEPYDFRVMTVTLTARNFSEIAALHMSGEQTQHYSVLMQTKGNRQHIANPFDFDWLPYVTSYYGWRVHPISGVKDLHRGVDIGVPSGTEIHAGQDGTVTFAGYSGDYGNVVVIDDGKGLVSKYAHCDTISVVAGQTVKTGDVIATVGNTGNSTGAHLHLEVMRNNVYLNPLYFAETGNIGAFAGIDYPAYPGEPPTDDEFAAMLAIAEAQIGKPYIWGAAGPDSFDCSGFLCYVINQSGVDYVGRVGATGLFNYCVPIQEPEPGDLIFFEKTYDAPLPVTHVGLYVGNGYFIHAGKPVKYSNISEPYYAAHLYAYGRLP